LRQGFEKACELNKEAELVMEQYSSGNIGINSETYKHALRVYVDNFNYCTLLPFWFLYSINLELEKGRSREEFKDELAMYEGLKGQTRYPQLTSIVLSKFFEMTAKILNVTVNDASFLTPDEMQKVFDGENIPIPELKLREKGCAMTPGKKPYDIIFNYDQDTFKHLLYQKKENISEFKGNIAYKGIVQGKVKIVNSTEDMDGFQDGDILVSINTSPSLMPVITKCAAIVTDEGGIMCHASIISREMKIPCVIGTKIATRVLKNGDMVEVDANKGVVKIIR
jgi:phosphohistidine swiveling domain-containing protein